MRRTRDNPHKQHIEVRTGSTYPAAWIGTRAYPSTDHGYDVGMIVRRSPLHRWRIIVLIERYSDGVVVLHTTRYRR